MTVSATQVTFIVEAASPTCETVRRAIEGSARLTTMVPDAASSSLSARLVSADVDLVLVDLQRGWDPAIEILRRVKSIRPDVPVLLVDVDASVPTAVEAMRAGFDDCVALYGVDIGRLAEAVRQAVERSRSESHATRRTSPLETILQRLRVGFFRLSQDGILSRANRAVLELLGLPTLAEARRIPLHDRLLAPEMPGLLASALRRDGRVPISEAVFRRPDGGLANLWLSETLGTTVGGESVIDGIVFETVPRGSDAPRPVEEARAESLPLPGDVTRRESAVVA